MKAGHPVGEEVRFILTVQEHRSSFSTDPRRHPTHSHTSTSRMRLEDIQVALPICYDSYFVQCRRGAGWKIALSTERSFGRPLKTTEDERACARGPARFWPEAWRQKHAERVH